MAEFWFLLPSPGYGSIVLWILVLLLLLIVQAMARATVAAIVRGRGMATIIIVPWPDKRRPYRRIVLEVKGVRSWQGRVKM